MREKTIVKLEIINAVALRIRQGDDLMPTGNCRILWIGMVEGLQSGQSCSIQEEVIFKPVTLAHCRCRILYKQNLKEWCHISIVKARMYSNPVPGMTFIHNETAYKVVRWDGTLDLWECIACGNFGVEPRYYCDAMVRSCAGMRLVGL